jgi:hypothetical protein
MEYIGNFDIYIIIQPSRCINISLHNINERTTGGLYPMAHVHFELIIIEGSG